MSMVLGVIITVAWLVILGPNLLKRRSRAGGINSISHFHRSLRILEQSGPQPLVTPAYRLRSVPGSPGGSRGPTYPDVAAVPVLTVVGADQLPRPALAFLGEDPVRAGLPASVAFAPEGPDRSDDASHPMALAAPSGDVQLGAHQGPSGHGAPGDTLRPVDGLVRHQVRRRRRDTLGVLAMVFVCTLLIGCIPGLGAAWLLSAASGVALAGYVWMLVQLRQQAEERERKLHYLNPVAQGASLQVPTPGVLGRASARPGVPVTMSGRYAHPSNQAAVGH